MYKIGLIFYGALNSPTGASTVIKNIFEGFRNEKQFDLTLYSLDKDGGHLQIKSKTNIKLKSMIFLKNIFHLILIRLSKRSLIFTKIYIWLKYHKNAMLVIKKNLIHLYDQDILFFHDIFTPYNLKKINSDLWKVKKKVIVLHTNGEVFKMLFSYFPKLASDPKTKAYYEINIAISILDDVDTIVLLSDHSKKIFLNIYPKYKNKVVVVPNGINISKSNIINYTKKSKFIFTTVGTVCKRKGQDLLIDAITLMSNSQRNLFELNIIGSGELLDELVLKCKQANINNVNFLGVKNNIIDYLKASDCFILVSRDEGLPIAILEAMSVGLPIIGTNVGGVPDLVKNNYNGILINNININNIVSAIMNIISLDESHKNILSKNSLDLFNSEFSLNIMIANYKKLFVKII